MVGPSPSSNRGEVHAGRHHGPCSPPARLALRESAARCVALDLDRAGANCSTSDLRPRDLALGVAWGLLPILVAVPVLLAVALAARFNASIAFLLALVALGLAFSASWMTLLATIEAGGWSLRPLAAAAVLLWGCVHWGVMTFTWITRMMTWAGFGID